jgi:hypothetical protein
VSSRAPVVAAVIAAAAPAFAFAACGGSGRPAKPTTPSNRAAGGTAGSTTVGPEMICDRIQSLSDAGCAPFTSYSLDRGACIEDMRKSLEQRGDDARSATLEWGACLGESRCDDVLACVDRTTSMDAGFRDCNDHSSSAVVGLPRVDWDRRRGATARKFSDVPTTKAEPIEVCMIEAEMEWLLQMVCDDGSRPFASDDHAHAARTGNVGAGGACGSIIDLYEVKCPEATYAIYMDAYVCPLP